MNFLKLLFSPYLVPKLLSTDSKPQTPSSQHHTLKPQRHRPRHHLPKPLLQPAPPFHLIKTSSSTFISHSPFAKKFKTRSEISQTLVPSARSINWYTLSAFESGSRISPLASGPARQFWMKCILELFDLVLGHRRWVIKISDKAGEETKPAFKFVHDIGIQVAFVHAHVSLPSMDVFEEKRNILEPAGALALTGAEAYCKHYGLQGKNIVVITSRANMNFDKLRVVTKLANIGCNKRLCWQLLWQRSLEVGQMNVTKFKYRCNSNEKAVVLYNVEVHTASELRAIQERMESSQLKTYNLIESKSPETTDAVIRNHRRQLNKCGGFRQKLLQERERRISKEAVARE
ncbi:hypothetical protein JHK82_031399 [Glycine max]|nr:hypothetical protein JHK82_031399 [Glycine max]